jgi:hypothetical protein
VPSRNVGDRSAVGTFWRTFRCRCRPWSWRDDRAVGGCRPAVRSRTYGRSHRAGCGPCGNPAHEQHARAPVTAWWGRIRRRRPAADVLAPRPAPTGQPALPCTTPLGRHAGSPARWSAAAPETAAGLAQHGQPRSVLLLADLVAAERLAQRRLRAAGPSWSCLDGGRGRPRCHRSGVGFHRTPPGAGAGLRLRPRDGAVRLRPKGADDFNAAGPRGGDSEGLPIPRADPRRAQVR